LVDRSDTGASIKDSPKIDWAKLSAPIQDMPKVDLASLKLDEATQRSLDAAKAALASIPPARVERIQRAVDRETEK